MFLPYNRTNTSKSAAQKARPIARGQKREILKFILAAGVTGVTAEEVSIGTGIKGDSLRPRLLCLEMEKSIRRTGLTRKTTSGRDAEIWVSCEGANKRVI